MWIPVALALLNGPVHADEGMWLPEQVDGQTEELKAMGLEVPIRDLADPKGALLGSVVSLGH
ncbi:MAG: S46 family peptidase, partial [Myxococcota bacterium]|nr:S46 family peptidase [Myxococcota bacterium]